MQCLAQSQTQAHSSLPQHQQLPQVCRLLRMPSVQLSPQMKYSHCLKDRLPMLAP